MPCVWQGVRTQLETRNSITVEVDGNKYWEPEFSMTPIFRAQFQMYFLLLEALP